MACKLARQAESRPYCMLATATMPHIRRHFLFAQRDVSGRRAGDSFPVVMAREETPYRNFMIVR